MKAFEREHFDRIRERFTTTAEPFTQFVLSRRTDEAERLATMATAEFPGATVGVDLACGPGTFALSLATRLKRVIGVDLTPAMLSQAGQAAAQAGMANLAFVCADANTLPFADGAFDVALCGYALHHLLAPEQAIREMARVVRSGGRIAIVDKYVLSGDDVEAMDHIERMRDPSHTNTLSETGLRSLLTDAGLRVLDSERRDRPRSFDQWMHVAGRPPGSPIYVEIRRLLEASLVKDATGFHPCIDPATGALQVILTALFLVAEKA